MALKRPESYILITSASRLCQRYILSKLVTIHLEMDRIKRCMSNERIAIAYMNMITDDNYISIFGLYRCTKMQDCI